MATSGQGLEGRHLPSPHCPSNRAPGQPAPPERNCLAAERSATPPHPHRPCRARPLRAVQFQEGSRGCPSSPGPGPAAREPPVAVQAPYVKRHVRALEAAPSPPPVCPHTASQHEPPFRLSCIPAPQGLTHTPDPCSGWTCGGRKAEPVQAGAGQGLAGRGVQLCMGVLLSHRPAQEGLGGRGGAGQAHVCGCAGASRSWGPQCPPPRLCCLVTLCGSCSAAWLWGEGAAGVAGLPLVALLQSP